MCGLPHAQREIDLIGQGRATCGVLAQREMEKRRSPLVSIPPFGRGFSRHWVVIVWFRQLSMLFGVCKINELYTSGPCRPLIRYPSEANLSVIFRSKFE
jgi:hypothetical protein